MAKKRFPKYPPKPSVSKKRRKGAAAVHDPRTRLADKVLSFLAGRDDFSGLGEIIIGLDLPRHERKGVKDILIGLEKKHKVVRRGNKYRLSGDAGLIKAVLEINSRGFGFAVIEGTTARESKDPFISRNNLNGASQGDTVYIKLLEGSGKRPEARVVKILNRGITRFCGIYTSSGKTGYVTPDNERLPFTVQIRKGNSLGAANNLAVLVDILDHGEGGRPPEGKIVEVLGDPLLASVQTRMAIEQFELVRTFPKSVRQETERLIPLTECSKDRTDLRHIPHVTIDGETAKDFDDAIAVEKSRSGYKLYVSIADVSHYVKPGSAIDQEAYRRGTSVYFPDLVVPMLPERLSNDLCSLVPDQDRPAFTAVLEFNKKGKRTGQHFCKSMIRSRQRFTYKIVQKVAYDRAPGERKTYAALLPMLDDAAALADQLWNRRLDRGSIGFDIPEPEIVIQDDKVHEIKRAERNRAHHLIEEFMLAANEAVAETLARENRPVLYRIHERPDPLKVELFTEAIAAMGLQLPSFELSPSWFARVVREAEHSPAQYVINNLMLRTMQQARYSPQNAGHFGLAAEYYLHFTSPIRRYPDLVAHRVLQNLLAKSGGTKEKPALLPGPESLEEAGIHLSKRERISVDVERNTQARLSALFLLDHVGEEFDGIISGVSTFGLFIELLDSFISGAVPVGEMRDDYYILDTKSHKYIGEQSGKIFQMGNLVRVRLERVDILAKKITFSIVAKN